jgi:hypothetical protein
LAAIAPTVDLSSDWTDFLASHQQNAEIIGQIFGVEDEVAELWAAIEEQVAEVQALTADAGTALIVMVSGGEVTAYGTGSRFGWIHEELGFTPVIEDIQEATHGEAISFEFILEANPDWLIVIDRDVAVGEQAESAVNVLDNELVAQTSAWQNGQVIPRSVQLVRGHGRAGRNSRDGRRDRAGARSGRRRRRQNGDRDRSGQLAHSAEPSEPVAVVRLAPVLFSDTQGGARLPSKMHSHSGRWCCCWHWWPPRRS